MFSQGVDQTLGGVISGVGRLDNVGTGNTTLTLTGVTSNSAGRIGRGAGTTAESSIDMLP